MRLAVYTDYQYRRAGGRVFAERAFALFLIRLADHVDRLVIIGKVNPVAGRSHYELPRRVAFAELPFYRSLARPAQAATAMARSVSVYWRALDDVDSVWLLGPHPLALGFAVIAFARGRAVALGVRQDFRRYVRARHPNRRWIHVTGDALDIAWRLLARSVPMVAVGPELAGAYTAKATLEIAVSLISESDIVTPEQSERDYLGPSLQVLSVGRLEEEKNPLLLADVLVRLRAADPRWRLVICGEGPMEPALRDRLRLLEVSDHAELRGYVAQESGLRALYRESHAFLHVSWTEGLPQVLFEAFAARLPVVATAVGGVPAAADGAALLIAPNDAPQAAAALGTIADDAKLRARLTATGVQKLANRTLDAEAARVARFLKSGGMDS